MGLLCHEVMKLPYFGRLDPGMKMQKPGLRSIEVGNCTSFVCRSLPWIWKGLCKRLAGAYAVFQFEAFGSV